MIARWRRFTQLSAARRALLVEATLGLIWARMTLLVFPFRRIAARLGGVQPAPGGVPTTHDVSASHAAIVRDIAWAVPCAARHVPFDAACLPQALAARQMLARRGVPSVLHFGLARATEDSSLMAHAWVDANGLEVTGYPVASHFTEVARFT